MGEVWASPDAAIRGAPKWLMVLEMASVLLLMIGFLAAYAV